ncbi:MAG: hypothetical protein HY538_07755 [Deltaproteobacteria bacterium]|nr:hypothetical protein [Deltaproteobacteria bacterium]
MTLLPLNSLKRSEVYSFIGGLFVSISWVLYWHEDKDDFFEPIYLLAWLWGTIALFVVELILLFFVFRILLWLLRSIDEDNLYKIARIEKDPIQNYIWCDYVDSLLESAHLIIVVLLSLLFSSYPLYNIAQTYLVANSICPIIIVALFLSFILLWLDVLLLRQYSSILLLKSKSKLDFVDKKKYAEKRAEFYAEICNERDRKELEAMKIASQAD